MSYAQLSRPEPTPESEPDTETVADAEPVAEPEAPARLGPRACAALVPFDSDGDGRLTALDRYWRHLHLWTDENGDAQVGEWACPGFVDGSWLGNIKHDDQ